MAEISREILGVGDLNRAIAEVLDGHIGSVWVRGEISNFKAYDSGHWYFSLKDAEGQIRAVMFRGRNAQVGFIPKEGDLVEVAAQVGLYVPRGDIQLNVQLLRKAGQGGLYEAFIKLKTKLEKEGLFDESRKRALPKHPRGIGIATSPQAAALKDVLTTLSRRAPHIPVTIYPSLVQGVEAPAELMRALGWAYADASHQQIDVILLVRGGGSIEDLWAFNDEALARLIATAPVPLVCGVGHETDFTIADFVADARAPTPTGAAELATPNRQALMADLSSWRNQMDQRLTARLERESQRLDQLSLRLAHAIPDPARMQERKEQLTIRMRQAWQVAVGRYRQQLGSLGGQIETLNPQRTLERGYAVVINGHNEVVMSPDSIQTADILQLRLAKGQVGVQVTKLVSDEPTG